MKKKPGWNFFNIKLLFVCVCVCEIFSCSLPKKCGLDFKTDHQITEIYKPPVPLNTNKKNLTNEAHLEAHLSPLLSASDIWEALFSG